jgi:hypothetical protein
LERRTPRWRQGATAELNPHLCRFRLKALISDAIGYIVAGTELFDLAFAEQALDDPWTGSASPTSLNGLPEWVPRGSKLGRHRKLR